MATPTRFVAMGEPALKEHEYQLNLIPQEERAERKCKPCEGTTEKIVVNIIPTKVSGQEMAKPKIVYCCIKCGELSFG